MKTIKTRRYENAQARMRTLVLMDIANDANGIVIGTGDLSELALGWATYNGDHMSMYGVNASVPKTLVRHLIAYEGKRLGGAAGAVLEDILHTEISPELLPPEDGKIAQKTESWSVLTNCTTFICIMPSAGAFRPKRCCISQRRRSKKNIPTIRSGNG